MAKEIPIVCRAILDDPRPEGSRSGSGIRLDTPHIPQGKMGEWDNK